MVGVQSLLLNIFLIFCAIFLSFMMILNRRWNNGKVKINRKLVVFILAACTIILCMSFPFSMFPGYFYDLRIIPLLLGMLYGGNLVGWALAVILFGYRYYLGGDGFYTTVYAYCVVISIASFYLVKYRSASIQKRLLIGLSLSFFASFLVTVISYIRMDDSVGLLNQQIIMFFVMYCLLHVLAMWMAIYIIEMMHENLMLWKEVERAEKMYVLGELAASIAHEIRNPMTVVRGFVQLLSNQEIGKANKSYMELVISELDRAETIIEDYLSYARPQIDKKEEIEIGELMKQVINIVEGFTIMKNVQISYEMQDSLRVIGDSKKLAQVFINLLKNGVEAMPDGGMLQIHCYTKDDNVIIDIADNGVGMDKAEIERLGNPFYSTKEKGTGLGLMVSYRIIEKMGGKIQVCSRKGEGTKFSIILPAIREDEITLYNDLI